MAFKCQVNLASLLPFSNVQDDGLLFVDNLQGNGDFTGRHRINGQDKPMKGKCQENPHKFKCDREGFKYDGEIFDFGNVRIVVGLRSPKNEKDRKDGEEANGDEVWVGVKVT